ncbi:LysR family transcriptional regulator [Litoreibacter arenae]|uniref:Transcriptional regulator, LysR family n=1 Tax=Litoreibacter arenae DSM 19593 TaxID=1123360 RepID=S9RST8_9RHOB|nr:LysR family transcriptional regulator [Litoreibacter arenae]EPX81100.1 transcriptional regulator, LysR family [Litoreibacter arenae DSM 19593]
MQTRALETLVRILQVQSFGEAAQLQNMTLSALSMQMKALEAELDAELFDRSFRPPRLTPLGRKVAEQAKGVISGVAELHELANAGAGLSGSFQLGFIQSASARILPKFVTLAAEREKRASFRYSSNLSEALTEQVALGQLDAAIVTRVEGGARGLHVDLIASEPMALAVPVALAQLDAVQLSQQVPFIHFRPSTGIGKLIAASLGAEVPPQNTLVLDSIEACMECVKEGVGYTVLPLPDIRRYADGRVHVVEGAMEGLTRDLVMLTRDDAQAQRWRPRLLSLVRDAA